MSCLNPQWFLPHWAEYNWSNKQENWLNWKWDRGSGGGKKDKIEISASVLPPPWLGLWQMGCRGGGSLVAEALLQLWESCVLDQTRFWRTAEILTTEPGILLSYISRQHREVQNVNFLYQHVSFKKLEPFYGVNSCVRGFSEGLGI